MKQEPDMQTILLVDADPDCLLTIANMLNSHGYDVITAQDGASALSILGEGARIDLVITDYRLPGMDALELLSAVKKISPLLPSIVLAGFSTVEMYLQALSFGVFEYLSKPIRTKEIGLIVKTALSGKRRSGEAGSTAGFLHTALT